MSTCIPTVVVLLTLLVMNFFLFSFTFVEAIDSGNSFSISEGARDIHRHQIESFRQYILSGRCKHVYIDLGTNIGVQLRKLYQPDHFKWAKVHRLFSEYFGHNRTNVCALGIEANPRHAERLLELQSKYQSMNYPMVILTSTAVSVEDGLSTFFYNGGPHGGDHQWAGSVSKSTINESSNATVISVDINRILMDFFLIWEPHRLKYMSIPDYNVSKKTTEKNSIVHVLESKVVAKIDIEGEEFRVIPHMLSGGSFCKLDLSMVEWHPHSMRNKNVFIPWEWGMKLRTGII